ncbi:hypothetical protein Trydic_g20946 [Trypoxylus dichotomus]
MKRRDKRLEGRVAHAYPRETTAGVRRETRRTGAQHFQTVRTFLEKIRQRVSSNVAGSILLLRSQISIYQASSFAINPENTIEWDIHANPGAGTCELARHSAGLAQSRGKVKAFLKRRFIREQITTNANVTRFRLLNNGTPSTSPASTLLLSNSRQQRG